MYALKLKVGSTLFLDRSSNKYKKKQFKKLRNWGKVGKLSTNIIKTKDWVNYKWLFEIHVFYLLIYRCHVSYKCHYIFWEYRWEMRYCHIYFGYISNDSFILKAIICIIPRNKTIPIVIIKDRKRLWPLSYFRHFFSE